MVSDNDLAKGEVDRRPVTGTALVCRVNNRAIPNEVTWLYKHTNLCIEVDIIIIIII